MNFNFEKYERRRFHENREIDKKIKALLLYYDYQVEKKELSLSEQLTLIDDWINKFEQHELYEVIPTFKIKRALIIKSIIGHKKNDANNMTFLEMARLKIKKFVKNIFNRK